MGIPEIELDAAQALFAARMLEAAVHHPGPWSFKWGEVVIPATKEITEAGIVFTGTFPDLCWLRPPTGSLMLLCEDTIMGMRSADRDHPGDTSFEVRWEILTRHERARQN